MMSRLSHRSLPAAAGAVLMFGLLFAAGASAWPVGARLGIASVAAAGAWILYRQAVRLDHTSVDDARRDTWDRYLRTLDHMLEGCQIIDAECRYVYLNEAAARHGRRPREELVGRTMMEAYPGIETTALFAAIRRALVDKTVSQLESEFTYPDGTTAWFELRIQPVPQGVFILSMDITDRKNAGKRLSESEERFRQMAENIRDVFWLTDPSKNEMLYVSPAYEEIWSQSREGPVHVGLCRRRDLPPRRARSGNRVPAEAVSARRSHAKGRRDPADSTDALTS
jgi:PAS domain S-box-containing protein